MTKPRKLVKGDRVKITGLYGSTGGSRYIGKFAVVNKVYKRDSMSIGIRIDDDLEYPGFLWFWDRENLRALPRKAQPNER